MVRELQVKVHRVIIPDQIVFWKSKRPGYYDYLFSQLTLNTKNLLDHLNFSSKIHVVGHSMGGGPATHLASRYPEKFNKLTLVNPVGLERYQDYVQTEAPQFFYENLELKKIPEKVRNYQKIVLL